MRHRRMKIFMGIFLFMILICLQLVGCADKATTSNNIPWDISVLNKQPKMKWLNHQGPVFSLEYQGLPYNGKETRVFAYYATPGSISGNPALDKDLPGVILIHGGGGHAQPYWVSIWAKFGYAALSMDLQGCGSDFRPLPNSVPAKDYLNYDFNYHMVANVILAHSLLLSFKEVNTDRTAVTGYSVGGQITDIVAGIDKRFIAASSIFGCGYLHENSLFSEKLSQMNKSERDKWIKAFDPSSYLGSVTIPMLFITGADDPYYPLDSYVKTYKLAKGPRNLCIIPGIHHDDVTAVNSVPTFLFIDQYCRNGVPLPSIELPEIVDGQAQAQFQCKTRPLEAAMFYTTDTGASKDCKWSSVNASIVGSTIISPKPPENASAWLIAMSDERKAVVSSEVILKRSLLKRLMDY